MNAKAKLDALLESVEDVIRSNCDSSGTLRSDTRPHIYRLANSKDDFDKANRASPMSDMPDPLTELVLRAAKSLHETALEERSGGGALDEHVMRAVAKPRHWTRELRQRVTVILLAAGWTMFTMERGILTGCAAWKPPVAP